MPELNDGVIRIDARLSPVAQQIDITLQGTEMSRDRLGNLRAIQAIAEGFEKESTATAKDKNLTPAGQADRVKKSYDAATEKLQDFKSQVDKIDTRIAGLRERATAPPKEHSIEDLFAEREIRDRIRDTKMIRRHDSKEMVPDTMTIGFDYLAALRNGDTAFVRAIETAPKAFPLVTAETLSEGAEIKIENSPQAEEIATLTDHRQVLNLIVRTAETGMTDIGKRFGAIPRY